MNKPYINNPQIRRAHEKAGSFIDGNHDEKKGSGAHPHSIHIHHAGDGAPHPSNPHHVHVHHADGSHEHSDHGSFEEAMSHAQSKASEAGAPLGGESGAPSDNAEMEDGY